MTGAAQERLSWFHPSEGVLHAVRDALCASQKSIAIKAKQFKFDAVSPQHDELRLLIGSNEALKDFVVRAVIGAIGAVVLEAQREEPSSIVIAAAGQFGAEIKTALRSSLPEQLAADPSFYTALYRDVVRSVSTQGTQVDLGRGKLILARDTLRLELRALEPTRVGQRVSAKIEILTP